MKRLLAGVIVVAAALALATAVLIGGGLSTSSAGAALPNLSASVVPTARGPLSRCPAGADCTTDNAVWWFVHVANRTQPQNFLSGNRATIPNAFVVDSVDETFLVDGVDQGFSDTLVPPPNLSRRFGSAGRFISTVTCGAPASPCTNVISPAVLPGEDVSVYFEGWFHTQGETNGSLVATFTVHGTFNGQPLDLTASSPPIQLTG
jgi:hypothetical protein